MNDDPYDNFVGKKNTLDCSSSLTSFLDLDEGESCLNPLDWEQHWKGMPEFVQDSNEPFMKILISFREEADYLAFAKLIDQNLSIKTKSIWYPKLDRTQNSLSRWIEE